MVKIVLQKVKSCSVQENSNSIAEIGPGYVLLYSFSKESTKKSVDASVDKILGYRLFDDWKSSVVDVRGEILVLSQFTLYGQFKGRKPSFHQTMGHEEAKELFEYTYEKYRSIYCEEFVKKGKFGSYLAVHLVNDGPCTFTFDF